jgi:hypothetical protein
MYGGLAELVESDAALRVVIDLNAARKRARFPV